MMRSIQKCDKEKLFSFVMAGLSRPSTSLLLEDVDARPKAGHDDRASGEPCFRGDICGFRPFAGIDFLAVGGLNAGNLEAAVGADNGESIRFDGGDFTELAADAFRVLRRDRLGVENPQLLAVERRPGAGRRIAAT